MCFVFVFVESILFVIAYSQYCYLAAVQPIPEFLMSRFGIMFA